LSSVRSGWSLRSLPRFTPPQFASPGLALQALIRTGKSSYIIKTLSAIIFELWLENTYFVTVLSAHILAKPRYGEQNVKTIITNNDPNEKKNTP
jgi:hypothetical protein